MKHELVLGKSLYKIISFNGQLWHHKETSSAKKFNSAINLYENYK